MRITKIKRLVSVIIIVNRFERIYMQLNHIITPIFRFQVILERRLRRSCGQIGILASRHASLITTEIDQLNLHVTRTGKQVFCVEQ